MSTPITHLAYSEKVYDRLFKDKDEADFYRGTLYPDIRYMRKNSWLDRFYTHTNANFNIFRYLFSVGSLNIEKAQKAKSFDSGTAFHSIVDSAIRDSVVLRMLSEIRPGIPIVAFKLLQDEILYDRLKDPQKYQKYLEGTNPKEINLLFDEKMVLKWHLLISNYISKNPSDQTRTQFAKGLGLSEAQTNSINKMIGDLRKDKKVVELIENIYDNLENYLELP